MFTLPLLEGCEGRFSSCSFQRNNGKVIQYERSNLPFFRASGQKITIFIQMTGYDSKNYKGPSSDSATFFQFIFGTWLPNSDYILDDRPHFEVLEERYTNDDPNSEEEIWIPIKPR
ncbi:MAG: GyrI-like domain-containing protein [Saprospiraceae bacterium]|nr:GyrI-like domain-containing protein [Saprospiraceae bacterium]